MVLRPVLTFLKVIFVLTWIGLDFNLTLHCAGPLQVFYEDIDGDVPVV